MLFSRKRCNETAFQTLCAKSTHILPIRGRNAIRLFPECVEYYSLPVGSARGCGEVTFHKNVESDSLSVGHRITHNKFCQKSKNAHGHWLTVGHGKLLQDCLVEMVECNSLPVDSWKNVIRLPVKQGTVASSLTVGHRKRWPSEEKKRHSDSLTSFWSQIKVLILKRTYVCNITHFLSVIINDVMRLLKKEHEHCHSLPVYFENKKWCDCFLEM